MKYILRIIALPFVVCIWLTYTIYTLLKGVATLSLNFLFHGGETICYDKSMNKKTILDVYLKVQDLENNTNRNCNHVWEQEVNFGQTNSPRKRCLVCGIRLNDNFFTN